ncbi:DUF1254 domain-containing protein [Acinetobacter rongchengensis]|uniref:DUF1254 domain-containing protein n=1 Tax=Acinetobacter rongchengensis TaxID=2419601 RepID=A0A3A8F769_9GAMM|nr:DUF1214 domain-containing protein [Acinetobacter rongchengensis]RKG38930.1 DUF1254 domain-containing protein [Acinetobacter rongchengensis]
MSIKRVILYFSFLLFFVAAVTGCSKKESTTATKQTETKTESLKEIATEAYIYAYSPVYAYWYLSDEVFNQKSTNYIGEFNKFRHYRVRNTPEDQMITPAIDILYSRNWLDLRGEPMVVSIPKITPESRYYVMQSISLDHYNLDFYGTRTAGSKGGNILYVGPSYKGKIDETKFDRVVHSKTDFVYLQGRILVGDDADVKKVNAIQDQIITTPYNKFVQQPATATSAGKSDMTPFIPADKMKALYSIETLDVYARIMPYIHLDNPSDLAMLERFKKIGLESGKKFDLSKFSEADQKEIQAGIQAGVAQVQQAVNNASSSIGLLGTEEELNRNYLNRDAGVGVGIFGNSPAEAMYQGRSMVDAKPGDQYVLHFDADNLPPIHKEGFWSVTMYNLPQRLPFHNEIERYTLGNRSEGLKYNKDGSLDLYFQSEKPAADKVSNWLPTPKEGPFFYILRMYVPQEKVSKGDWMIPDLKKVEK